MSKIKKEVHLNTGINERVLGMNWNIKKDAFQFNNVQKQLKGYMKREVLKLISSIFYPFGFLAPFTVSGKILLKELWQTKLRWDDSLGSVHQIF